MASRINVKFLVILIAAFGFAGAGLGSLAYLKIRGSASRFIRLGDEAMAQSDYRRARSYYRRAVSKDATNLVFVGKWEEALLKIQPETADEAREFYQEYVSLLKHAVEHQPTQPEIHRNMLAELFEFARVSDSAGYWGEVDKAADLMWRRVPETSPERNYALLYRGVAAVVPSMQERLLPEEVEEGQTDLETFLEAYPDDDTGWGTLITARLAAARRLRTAGQARRADEMIDRARDTARRAREAAPNGAEVRLALLRLALYEHDLNPAATDWRAVRANALEMVRRVRDRRDPWLIAQAAEVLLVLRQEMTKAGTEADLPTPIEVADAFLAERPERHDVRFLKARVHYLLGEYELAEATSREILAAGLMTVSYVSQLQFELKRRAASLMVDIAMQRWAGAETAEHPARLDAVRATLAALEAMTGAPDNDPLVLRARGKLAYAERRFGHAADLFDKLAREGVAPDVEILQYAAIALEHEGATGRAADYLFRALNVTPDNIPLLEQYTRLLVRLRRYDEATVAVLRLRKMSDTPLVHQLEADIARATAGGGLTPTDPLEDMLEAAQDALDQSDFDGAQSLLAGALADDPENLRLLNAIVRVEIVAGRPEDARRHLDQALRIAPSSLTFNTLRYALENEDPADAARQYAKELYEDERDQVVQVLADVARMAVRQEELAQQHEAAGRGADAERARALAVTLRGEEATYAARAAEIAPDHPRFIEYRFVKATFAEDWEELRRVTDRAVELNADRVGGAIFEGRFHTILGNHEEAVKALRRATDAMPYNAPAWKLLAYAYQRLGNNAEALRAFERAYETNPIDLATLQSYAALLERTGAQTRALLMLRHGRRLAPANPGVRAQWLALETEVGEPAIMLRERRRMYADFPGGPASREAVANAVALARYLGTGIPGRATFLDQEGRERYTAEQWERIDPVQKDRLIDREIQAWRAEADAIVEQVVPVAERDLVWHQLKADLLRARGEIEAGRKLLETWAAGREAPGDRLDALLVLGRYHALADQPALVVEVLGQARGLQEGSDRRVDLALAQFHFGRNEFAEALTYFDAVQAAEPSRETELQAIECAIKLGHFDEVRQRRNAVTAEGGEDYTTTMLDASLAEAEADHHWAQGRNAEALRRSDSMADILKRAASLQPHEPMPLVLGARGLYKRFQHTNEAHLLDDALRALASADEIKAGVVQTGMVRAAVLQAMGRTQGVISELSALLARFPANNQARGLYVQALLGDNRIDAAIDACAEAVRLQPNSAGWRERLGDLYVGYKPGNEGRAAEQYEAALKIEPSGLILFKLTRALVAKKPPGSNQAIRFLREHLQFVEESPRLRGVYAAALEQLERRDEAIEQLRLGYASINRYIAGGELPPQAIDNWFLDLKSVFGQREIEKSDRFVLELAAGTPNVHELRAMAKVWQTDTPETIERAARLTREAIAACPPEDKATWAGLHFELGVFLLRQERHDEALDAFEAVLVAEPEHAVTLNNLAYLIGEVMGDPARALPFAERAVAASPSDHNLLDTLGWTHYLLGNMDEAERQLSLSRQIRESPINAAHLSRLFLGRDDLPRAERYLQLAAELNESAAVPDPQTRQEIDRIADDIRTVKEKGR